MRALVSGFCQLFRPPCPPLGDQPMRGGGDRRYERSPMAVSCVAVASSQLSRGCVTLSGPLHGYKDGRVAGRGLSTREVAMARLHRWARLRKWTVVVTTSALLAT